MKKFSPRTNANVPNDGRCTFFVHFRLRFFNADITWLNAIARLRSERLKNYSWDSFKTFFPVPCRHQSLLFFLSIFGILLIKLFIATKKKKKTSAKDNFPFFFLRFMIPVALFNSIITIYFEGLATINNNCTCEQLIENWTSRWDRTEIVWDFFFFFILRRAKRSLLCFRFPTIKRILFYFFFK